MAWLRRSERRSLSYQSLWGQARDSAFSAPMQLEHAITMSAVYSATSLLADLISAFPLQSTKREANQDITMPNTAPLLADPTAFGTSIDWTHRAVISMALRGNAFGYITGLTPAGWPRRIEWLHPDEVSIRSDRSVAAPQWFWLGRPVPNELFVHIPYYTIPGRILGVSPIKAYAMTVESGLMAQKFGRDYFKNGTIPGGYIKAEGKYDPDAAKDIIEKWNKMARGRGVAVLGQNMDYHQITVPPEESQFLLSMKYGATQVAGIYHLPPEMVGGDSGSSMTYANIENRSIDIARLALSPYVTRIEASLFNCLPRPQKATYNMDSFQRPDMLTRYTAYTNALTAKWMTPDEVRAKENMAPLPDGQGSKVIADAPAASDGTPDAKPDAPKNDNPASPGGLPQPAGPGGEGSLDTNSLGNGNGKPKLTPQQVAVMARRRTT